MVSKALQLFYCDGCGYMTTGGGVCPEDKTQMIPVVCHRCGEPIYSGEPRYTAGEYNGKFSHYDCKKLNDEKLDRDLRRIKGGAPLADLLKRLKL